MTLYCYSRTDSTLRECAFGYENLHVKCASWFFAKRRESECEYGSSWRAWKWQTIRFRSVLPLVSKCVFQYVFFRLNCRVKFHRAYADEVDLGCAFETFWEAPGPFSIVIYIWNCDFEFDQENTYRTRHVKSTRKIHMKCNVVVPFGAFCLPVASEFALTLTRYGPKSRSAVCMVIYISNAMLQFDR